MKKVVGFVSAVAIFASGLSVAFAADGPFTKEIKARQGLMQVAAFNIGVLAAMAKGKRDYDAKIADTAARSVHMAAMIDDSALLWPQGSDLTNKDLSIKTAAKIEAWTTFPKVTEKHKTWLEASAELAKVAGSGLDALKPAVGAVGKSCKGCHDDFRQKKK